MHPILCFPSLHSLGVSCASPQPLTPLLAALNCRCRLLICQWRPGLWLSMPRHCPHEVMPSEGRRVVVAAYTLQAALHLDAHPRPSGLLARTWFPFCHPADFVYSSEALAPHVLPLTPSQRALLPSPLPAPEASAPATSNKTSAGSCHNSSAPGSGLGPCHLPSPTPRLFLGFICGGPCTGYIRHPTFLAATAFPLWT